jgi:protein SCO1/2
MYGYLARLFGLFFVFMIAVVVFAPTPVVVAPSAMTITPPTSGCDLGLGHCTERFDDAHAVTLSITPVPIRVISPLSVVATFPVPASNVRVTFTSTTMDMGTLTVQLFKQADGTFSVPTALPICTKSIMRWQAALDADIGNEAHHASFAFTTERSTGEAGGVVAGASSGTDSVAAADPVTAVDPAVVVDFTLQGARGPVNLHDTRGKVTLVYFGYATCPDVCPTALAALGSALKQLTPEEQARTATIFVSVDPERDRPETLDSYASFFHPGIRGVTGTPEAVKSAATLFGVAWAKYVDPAVDPKSAAAADYVVDHTSFTALVGPDGRYTARLAHAAPAPAVIAAIRASLATTAAPGVSP